MKYTRSIYYVLIFVITLLTYEQYLGLNALFIPIIISAFHYSQHKNNLSVAWKIAALLWVLSGLGIFLWHLDLGVPLFIISGLHYFSVSFHPKISIPNSLLQALISVFTGIGRFFVFKHTAIQITSLNEQSKRLIRQFLILTIPLIIFIVFLKLYQSANPQFAELTAFINLNFIELPFFMYFALLSILAFGFFFFKPSQKILFYDLQKNNIIHPEKYSSQESQEKTNFEWQIGLAVVSSLTVLLLAFIWVDYQTVFSNSQSDLSHSQSVHQSINILIASIVLVIIIVLYLFRGGLNFQSPKYLNSITYFWLFLNALVIALILVKNSYYISEWGLTHKRIGVYIYSFLCIIGLSFTVFKILLKKSTSFLVEKTSLTFLIILVAYGLFNWNGFIAGYNLNEENLTSEKIDFQYISSLGPEVYPQIISYISTHPHCHQSVQSLIGEHINSLQKSYSTDWTKFLSYTYSGYSTYLKLKNYQTPDNGYHFFLF